MLYIFSLLNSPVTMHVLWKLFGNENEKSFQVGIKTIKEFCRVPKIGNTNEHLKKEVIALADELVMGERSSLMDHVDFRDVLLQKFDRIEMADRDLHLGFKGSVVKCPITGDIDLVKHVIHSYALTTQDSSEARKLATLKLLPAVDQRRQVELKKYIDDLVFSLYFNVKLPKIGFESRQVIRNTCKKHEYYAIINEGL